MIPRDPNDPSDDALRWQLRALRRDAPPARDLWPDIAARLAAVPQAAAPRPPRRRAAPFALAASVLLAVAMTWQLQHHQVPVAGPLIQREAAALTRDYTGALAQLDAHGQASPELAPALHALDRSAADIRRAIATDPDARFLLERLRRTYARRLALTQRAALTT